MSSANKRGESIDHDKYRPITRHAESHRQLGVTGGSRTNLFEQALSKPDSSDKQQPAHSAAGGRHTPLQSVFKTGAIDTGNRQGLLQIRPGLTLSFREKFTPSPEIDDQGPAQKSSAQTRMTPTLKDSTRYLSPTTSARHLYKPLLNGGSGTK